MPRTALAEPLPDRLPPMLLRPGLPPAGAQDQRALELKWDGMRAQLRVARDGRWCLRSRPGRNCSDQFPELEPVADVLHGREVLLDGELVCLDADGRPDFYRLRRRLSASNSHAASLLAARHPATLIVFDVLHVDGRAVRALPYHRRRELLARTLPAAGPGWQTPAVATFCRWRETATSSAATERSSASPRSRRTRSTSLHFAAPCAMALAGLSRWSGIPPAPLVVSITRRSLSV